MARYKKDARGYYHTSVALPNGRRKHVSAKTIAELEKRKAEAAIKPPDCTTKLRDYALRWFGTYQVTKAYKTREMYAHIIDKYICDPEIGIGHVPMGDLRPMVIQEFLLRVRGCGGTNSMRRTCEQVIVTLKQIEKAAIRDGIIMNQYTYGVSLEREARLEKRALTQDEEAAVYLCELPYREKAAIMILYGCGLRRGELLALQRGDIDLEARTISVRRGVVYMGNNPIVQSTTKTASGIRTIPVPKSVMPAITNYLGKLGDIADSDYIFPGSKDDTNPVTLCTWRHMWARIIKAMIAVGASCEGLTPHCLRHNYATRCYYSDLTTHMAAKLMGHASTEMIEHVYAHLKEEREEAASKIDQAFPKILSMDRPEVAPIRLVK